jgi:hypothetical protein
MLLEFGILDVYWRYGLPALLACVALITNPYVMSAVSWVYPNGMAIAYAFAAMAFLLPGFEMALAQSMRRRDPGTFSFQQPRTHSPAGHCRR